MCCISLSGKSWKRRKTTMQVGRPQRLEARDVRAAGLDEPGLGIGREEHAALESVVLREDPRQRRAAILPNGTRGLREKHDVLAARRVPSLLHRRRDGDSARMSPARGETSGSKQQESAQLRSWHTLYTKLRERAQLKRTTRKRARRCERRARARVGSPRGEALGSNSEANRSLHDPGALAAVAWPKLRVDLLPRRVELRVGVDRWTSSPG